MADTVASSFVGANGTATITYAAVGSCAADTGQISAFTVGSAGALSPVAGSPFASGSTPVAIASTPNSGYIYATDLTLNALLAFKVSSTGALTEIDNGSIATGGAPDALTVDAAGQNLYVANYNANSVSLFSISQSTGIPTASTAGASFGVSTAPTYVFIEPSANKYLYTSDFIDSTVYGTLINTQDGSLSAIEHTPLSGRRPANSHRSHHSRQGILELSLPPIPVEGLRGMAAALAESRGSFYNEAGISNSYRTAASAAPTQDGPSEREDEGNT